LGSQAMFEYRGDFGIVRVRVSRVSLFIHSKPIQSCISANWSIIEQVLV